MSELFQWAQENDETVLWLTIGSVVMFFGTLIVIPILVSRMRADYFMPELGRSSSTLHPVLRIMGAALKNMLGVLIAIMGVLMIFTPGQGLLTILFGVMLIDFPGKREFELWLVRKKPVLDSINWIRRKAGKDPLVLPE